MNQNKNIFAHILGYATVGTVSFYLGGMLMQWKWSRSMREIQKQLLQIVDEINARAEEEEDQTEIANCNDTQSSV